MSQNRGFRRDNRPSYPMSTSYGGRSGVQAAVNPWEGGMVPGRSGVGGGGGLLPTSTEAQLALASNLLSSLLRPSQGSQVQSLLNLDPLPPMGYREGSGYGYGSGSGYGRYDDISPYRRRQMDMKPRDQFNKNQQGRRNLGARSGPQKKPGGGNSRSPTVNKNRTKTDKKDDKDKKEGDSEKKTEGDAKGEDGETEKKRDWKDEKKSDEEKGEKSKASNTRYSGIPSSLFECHVCKKHMRDETSFLNHIKGRTHLLMMDNLEESYKIKVQLMRHEQMVAEQQREIELERMKRQGKKVNMNLREYCTMCDLHFYGSLSVHRKNEHHQTLKNFLHPRCAPCGKEFPTRMEWDHHKLTPLHLKKTAESRAKSRTDDEYGIEELISAKEGEDVGDIEVRTRQQEENEVKEDTSNDLDKSVNGGNEGSTTEAAGDGEEKKEETETTIGRFKVPKYNPEVAVGVSLLKRLNGHICRACRRFFLNSEDAKIHCRTQIHYTNFIELVKEKAIEVEAKEKEKAESKKRPASPEGEKGTSSVDDEGNWKRPKVANPDDEDEDGDKKDETMETDENKDGDQEENGEEDEGDEAEKTEDSEADQEVGNLLDSLEGEGDADANEDLNEDELLDPKQDSETTAKETRSRNKAVRGGGVNKAVRGRKKK